MAGVRRGADAASTDRPVSADPVSRMRSKAADAATTPVVKLSSRTCNTPAGNPASVRIAASACKGPAQPGAGLAQTAFPAASACMICAPGRNSGEIGRGEHQHHAAWLAMDLCGDTEEPERAAAAQPARGEKTRRSTLKKADTGEKRQHLGRQRVGEGTPITHRCRDRRGARSEQAPGAAQNAEPLP